ncbi:Wzz/FepE/Etk N-terminal domain-containing protein [Shewanella donghaensis]|uniref:Wzz/FepE/Etk N-terminal domain-containing protein n=1 Tax=Shewanella donghaensis TaxID=238836 RepID=UPI0011844CB6|nr:Wzz/FepE/Etk N-terminal domain-containing protein [Shewanella donghaensis]
MTNSNRLNNENLADFIPPEKSQNDVDLKELFNAIWSQKIKIIVITGLFAIASVFVAISLPNIYRSEALLAPASPEQQGGLGGLASQFGGIASMAGLNLGGGSTIDNTQLAMSVLKSRQFVENFINKHDILPELMAVKEWNPNSNSLIFDEDIFDAATNKWVRDVDLPRLPQPSTQEAHKVFNNIISIHLDKDSGLIRVAVEHISPTVAKSWVELLIVDINAEMKKRDVEEAERSRDFLQQQIAATDVAGIRTILYQLIEEQMKTIMFAEVRDEYVFKTIDPAIAPEEKIKPKRAFICIAITLLGGLLATGVVVLRFFWCKHN